MSYHSLFRSSGKSALLALSLTFGIQTTLLAAVATDLTAVKATVSGNSATFAKPGQSSAISLSTTAFKDADVGTVDSVYYGHGEWGTVDVACRSYIKKLNEEYKTSMFTFVNTSGVNCSYTEFNKTTRQTISYTVGPSSGEVRKLPGSLGWVEVGKYGISPSNGTPRVDLVTKGVLSMDGTDVPFTSTVSVSKKDVWGAIKKLSSDGKPVFSNADIAKYINDVLSAANLTLHETYWGLALSEESARELACNSNPEARNRWNPVCWTDYEPLSNNTAFWGLANGWRHCWYQEGFPIGDGSIRCQGSAWLEHYKAKFRIGSVGNAVEVQKPRLEGGQIVYGSWSNLPLEAFDGVMADAFTNVPPQVVTAVLQLGGELEFSEPVVTVASTVSTKPTVVVQDNGERVFKRKVFTLSGSGTNVITKDSGVDVSETIVGDYDGVCDLSWWDGTSPSYLDRPGDISIQKVCVRSALYPDKMSIGYTYSTIPPESGWSGWTFPCGNDGCATADIPGGPAFNVDKYIDVPQIAPTTLKKVEFSKPVTQWMDPVKLTFEREDGYDCKIVSDEAEAKLLARKGERVCLLEVDIPEGFRYESNTPVPTVSGRILGLDPIAGCYSTGGNSCYPTPQEALNAYAAENNFTNATIIHGADVLYETSAGNCQSTDPMEVVKCSIAQWYQGSKHVAGEAFDVELDGRTLQYTWKTRFLSDNTVYQYPKHSISAREPIDNKSVIYGRVLNESGIYVHVPVFLNYGDPSATYDSYKTDVTKKTINYKLYSYALGRNNILMQDANISIPAKAFYPSFGFKDLRPFALSATTVPSLYDGTCSSPNSHHSIYVDSCVCLPGYLVADGQCIADPNATVATIVPQMTADFPSDAAVCSLVSDVEAAAKGFDNLSGPGTCLVEWQHIPGGVTFDRVGNSANLYGTPTEFGSNLAIYNVYVVHKTKNNTIVKQHIGTHSGGRVYVQQISPPTFKIINSSKGVISDEARSLESTKYLVSDDGIVGDILVNGGDYSTIKMTVLEIGSPVQTYRGLKNGDVKQLTISKGTKGAWKQREVVIRLEYEEAIMSSQNSTTLPLVQLPTSGAVLSLPKPSSAPNDVSPFNLIATVGVIDRNTSKLQYTGSSLGEWKVGLYIKQGGVLTRVADDVTIDSSGNAKFSGLIPLELMEQQLWAKATPVVPPGFVVSPSIEEIVTDRGLTLNFVNGRPLEADTKLSSVRGKAPLKQTLDLTMTQDVAEALKTVTWYYSDDEMVTWKPLGVMGRNVTSIFSKGGTYFVKGQMVNKFTNQTSWSSVASFDAMEIITGVLTGDDLVLPGASTTVTLNAKNASGAAQTEFDSVWEVTDAFGNVNTYNNTATLDLASATPTSFMVSVKVKAKTMDAGSDASWSTVTKKVVFFAPAKPKVTVAGPSLVESGKTGDFTVKLSAPWDASTKTSLKLVGKWVLPDGTESTASVLKFTPDAANGARQAVKYMAWVEGMQDSTTAIGEQTVGISTYVFPIHKLVQEVDSKFAPAYIKMTAYPATSFDMQQMRGKKLTYSWSIPQGLAGKGVGNGLRGVVDMPGTYNVRLTITDDRGNSQTLEHSIEITQTIPYEMTLNLQPALKYNRAPMTYLVKPTVRGGHPKDSVISVQALIDDTSIYTGKNMPRQLVVSEAGERVVKLKVNTKMGQTYEGAATVTVNENQLPTCSLVKAWDSKKTTVKVTPNCTDADGRVTRIVWYRDGEKQTRASSSFYATLSQSTPSVTVGVDVYDDAGGIANVSETISLQ